jgi:hypothetical protein
MEQKKLSVLTTFAKLIIVGSSYSKSFTLVCGASGPSPLNGFLRRVFTLPLCSSIFQ